jgi:hypothetical protein
VDIVGTPKRTPFRFEKFWLAHPDFQKISSRWWDEATIPHGSLMYRFQQKLKNFKQKIKDWNKTTFDNIFKVQRVLEKKMKAIQQALITQGERTNYWLRKHKSKSFWMNNKHKRKSYGEKNLEYSG